MLYILVSLTYDIDKDELDEMLPGLFGFGFAPAARANTPKISVKLTTPMTRDFSSTTQTRCALVAASLAIEYPIVEVRRTSNTGKLSCPSSNPFRLLT
jgi:hypothetical protein